MFSGMIALDAKQCFQGYFYSKHAQRLITNCLHCLLLQNAPRTDLWHCFALSWPGYLTKVTWHIHRHLLHARLPKTVIYCAINVSDYYTNRLIRICNRLHNWAFIKNISKLNFQKSIIFWETNLKRKPFQALLQRVILGIESYREIIKSEIENGRRVIPAF